MCFASVFNQKLISLDYMPVFENVTKLKINMARKKFKNISDFQKGNGSLYY